MLAMLLGASSAHGDLNLGTAADYAVVALGNGATVALNSGPNAGDFLLGNGVTANFAGGGNGGINGTLFFDPTTGGQNTFSKLQNPPVTMLVSGPIPATSETGAALASANQVAAFAAGLPPTLTIPGTISSATTFTGNGGLNVIDVTKIQNAPLTFSGGPNDIFVINVSQSFATNVPMTLSGVNASQILWNFTGTSGNVFTTSGGNTVFGTFLAAAGGSFQFSNLALTGALINTAGGMQIVSGSRVLGFEPFTPLAPVPEPSNFAIAGTGVVMGLGYWLRRRKRAA
jgi:hypothetical protein